MVAGNLRFAVSISPNPSEIPRLVIRYFKGENYVDACESHCRGTYHGFEGYKSFADLNSIIFIETLGM